jgi:hypothetical protein
MEKKDTDTVLMITLDKNLESKSYPFYLIIKSSI